MFLHHLSLRNVRCIEELDLDFTSMVLSEGAGDAIRKWTLILGQNGTGKSSVLRAASLILAGSEAIAELISRPDRWIRKGAHSAEIHATLMTSKGVSRKIHLVIEREDTVRDVFSRNHEAMDAIDGALKYSNRSYFTVGYGASRRLSSLRSFTPQEAFEHPRARSVATLFSPDAVLNPLTTWAMNLDYRRETDGLEVVKSALADLLPGVSLSHIDRSAGELIFDTQDGPLSLDQLSDGYQNMAAWCGDLLYRVTSTFEDYRDPMSARGLLLIDEVDLHLHPVWQRQLRQFLDQKFPNLQILATTHSPLTAQQSNEGELFTLLRPTPQSPPRLEPFLGAPNLLMAHQLLASPAFGIETLDSKVVQDLRSEYVTLSRNDKLSKADEARLQILASQLSDLPDWTTGTFEDQKQVELLSKLDAALTAPEGQVS